MLLNSIVFFYELVSNLLILLRVGVSVFAIVSVFVTPEYTVSDIS